VVNSGLLDQIHLLCVTAQWFILNVYSENDAWALPGMAPLRSYPLCVACWWHGIATLARCLLTSNHKLPLRTERGWLSDLQAVSGGSGSGRRSKGDMALPGWRVV